MAFNGGCCPRTSLRGRRFILYSEMKQGECMGSTQQSITCPCQSCPRQPIPPHRRDFGQPNREKRPARWQRCLRCRETHQGQKTPYISKMHCDYCWACTSPPRAPRIVVAPKSCSARLPLSYMKLILVTSMALAAYLVNSALRTSMKMLR